MATYSRDFIVKNGLQVGGDILPNANATYNLGSPTSAFGSLYLSGNTIYLGDLVVSADSSGVLKIYESDGVTEAAVSLTNAGAATGTFGSASKIPVITVGADGRITSISNTSVAGVSNFDYTTANNTFTITTADGGSFTATITDLQEVSDALSNLANTNNYIATESARIDLINTNLTSTNTAIRSLITSNDNDISTLNTNLTSTNTAIRSLISATNANVDQKLGATASITLSGDVSGSGSFSSNSVSITTTIADDSHNHSSSSGNFTVGSDLTVSGGDITLSGTGRIQGVDTVTAGTDATNKTYVDNAVAGVVDSAPEALNTLNELAAALGDDANFAATTATTLGTKAANSYVNATFSTLTQLGNTNSYIATKADATTQVIAGSGLTGGGTLAANRTLNIGAGTGITVAADSISTNDGAIVHDNLSGFVANEHIDHSTVSVTAGSGLTGGGTIAATRTINIGQGTGISVAADAISTNDSQIVHDNLSGFVADEHIAHSGVTLTAGNGLTGGGTIAASRTFAVGAGTLIDVTADAVNVDLSELSTSTTNGDGDYFVVVDTANAQRKLTKANINISGFNNDAGYLTAATESYSNATDLLNAIKTVDGAGSGLDADTLDGISSGSFLRSDTSDVQTSGSIRFNDNIELYIGTGNDVEHFWNGSNYYTDINGGANWYLRDGNSSNATRFTFDIDTGQFTCTDVNVTSDINLKDNINTIENALDKVDSLRGVSFDWKESGKKSIGVIAQEVEEVVPEVVATDEEGTKSVNYQAMVGLLIEAIKEQQKQINELKQIINNV
jgi:hypothetical protein